MNLKLYRSTFPFYLWTGVVFLVFWLFSDLANERSSFFPERFFNNIWRVAYVIVLNFILFEIVIPGLSWKKFLRSILILFVMLMLYSFGLYTWRHFGILIQVYTPLRIDASIPEGTGYHFPFSVGSIVFFGFIKHFYDYRKLKQATQQLRIEKQEAELNYLKSQTNPHFLFNTLNNIYSLSRDKSDQAPESILRLSKIMRYMLYDAGGEFIAIEHELKVISDYIALEKLRYDDTLRINFNYDIEDMKQAMPPLLLMPLVENAFKHGVSETRSQPFVDIHLSVNKRLLTFLVKNSSEQQSDGIKVKENIGLSNLRRQLELLYREYELKVNQGETVFTATLKINLASHV